MSSSPARPPATGTEPHLGTRLRDRGFAPVLTILSPPRCGSTTMARAFWQHPDFRWYVHEPFDRVYHEAADRTAVGEAVDGALDIGGPARGNGIVIKEMTFQAGRSFPELLAASTLPVVITVRDPRLAIRSRMRQRELAGQPPAFPVAESGWQQLGETLRFAREHAIAYVIVEFTELRARPATLLPILCDRLGIAFSRAMLSWPGRAELSLGQLGGLQSHWYRRVLTSTGFQPADEDVPGLDVFPGTMRRHVRDCIGRYHDILRDPRLLEPRRQAPPHTRSRG